MEWDDASRGKHSGDHQGLHYFTCRLEQTFSNATDSIFIASISDLCFSREGSGSFVRPKKVSLGYTFIEAVQEVHVHVYSLVPKVLPFPKLQARGEPGCEARRGGGVCTSVLSF